MLTPDAERSSQSSCKLLARLQEFASTGSECLLSAQAVCMALPGARDRLAAAIGFAFVCVCDVCLCVCVCVCVMCVCVCVCVCDVCLCVCVCVMCVCVCVCV